MVMVDCNVTQVKQKEPIYTGNICKDTAPVNLLSDIIVSARGIAMAHP